MQTADTIENYSVTMNRTLNAPIKAVYEAWTQKEALTTWFKAHPDMQTIINTFDLQVGGKYHFEMREPDGTPHVMYGEYVSLSPFSQLVFTWKWETDELKVDSLVTIDLLEKDGKTELTLLHERFVSQQVADMHNEGWTGCLAQLNDFFN